MFKWLDCKLKKASSFKSMKLKNMYLQDEDYY